MTATRSVVLVHGNPESAAVWDVFARRLVGLGHPDPVRLSPPGFGAPVPAGFRATTAEYRDWLIGELARLSGPIDLVGHDWGGGHVVNVAMARPDLLRSWASDAVGVFHPDYVWHPAAQLWQTPGDGEAWVAHQLQRTPAERAEYLRRGGVGDAAVADALAAAFDATMGECILRLYRSAAQPAVARLGAGLPAARARPGLALAPSGDGFVGTDIQRREAAATAGARFAPLPGLGHWWMTEDDASLGAAALTEFWTALPDAG